MKGLSCPIHTGPCEHPLKPRTVDLEFHALTGSLIIVVLNLQQTTNLHSHEVSRFRQFNLF